MNYWRTLAIGGMMIGIFSLARLQGNVLVSTFGWMPLFPLLMMAIGFEQSQKKEAKS